MNLREKQSKWGKFRKSLRKKSTPVTIKRFSSNRKLGLVTRLNSGFCRFNFWFLKIKIAFFRGHGSFVNKVVRWWTKSEYSHAELVMPDGLTWIGISPFKTSNVNKKHK